MKRAIKISVGLFGVIALLLIGAGVYWLPKMVPDVPTAELTEFEARHRDLARKQFYLREDLAFELLGYYSDAWLNDEHVKLKFLAKTDQAGKIFDHLAIDFKKFTHGQAEQHLDVADGVSWWDVKGKTLLLSGEIQLAKHESMSIGIEQVEAGFVVYVSYLKSEFPEESEMG